MPYAVVISRQLIEGFLEKFVPEAEELLALIRENTPGDGISPKLRKILTSLNIRNWAVLYQDPANEIKVPLLLCMSPEDIHATSQELAVMTAEEQSQWLQDKLETGFKELDELDEDIDEAEAIKNFEAMSDAEKAKTVRDIQLQTGLMLATVFNYFAYMAYRKSLYQLVSEALAGDDESFLRAIQIDKSILEAIPFFVERNRRAADEADFAFQRRIHDYRNKPIFRTRLRYRTMWQVFACLDQMNILDQYEDDIERFADLCQRLHIYGPPPEEEAVDVESFRKQLRAYKKDQTRLIPRPSQKVIVKDVSSSNSRP